MQGAAPGTETVEKDAMRGYKDQDVKERLARAAEARQKAPALLPMGTRASVFRFQTACTRPGSARAAVSSHASATAGRLAVVAMVTVTSPAPKAIVLRCR